jgi:hypothetical protein
MTMGDTFNFQGTRITADHGATVHIGHTWQQVIQAAPQVADEYQGLRSDLVAAAISALHRSLSPIELVGLKADMGGANETTSEGLRQRLERFLSRCGAAAQNLAAGLTVGLTVAKVAVVVFALMHGAPVPNGISL